MGEALVSYLKPPLAKLSGRMDLDQDAGHTDCRVALWTNTESLLSIQVTNDDLKLSPLNLLMVLGQLPMSLKVLRDRAWTIM